MRKIGFIFLLILNSAVHSSFAQLAPGFSPDEYRDFLGITVGSVSDTTFGRGIPQNPVLKRIYESPVVGLQNKWYLWVDES